MSLLTFSLIQADLRWEDKAANLQSFEEKITALAGKTQVVILPEMFSTGFSMKAQELGEEMSGDTVSWMKKTATKNKVILTGSVIIKEGDAYYNRLIWMLPNGQYGVYDKRHRFAYAGEDEHYTAGSKRFIASVNGWRINLQVCYDLRFPVWTRQQYTEEGFEYDVLIYVANWPERRNTAWKALLQARAIENQCYVIGVNRVGEDGNGIYHNGDSMVIDPLGEILYHKANDEDVFTIELDKAHLETIREKLPFWKDADDFQILI
ncbi:MAG: amidohydrolase [Flaviaesturariibacter sp.]|nr:amidohydrolase [Flaviaesturariibacter sp.]